MFTLSIAAEQDLVEIYLAGAASFGQARAARYHQRLFDAFDFIAENPLAAPLRPELRPEVRVHPVAAHIVLYTVRESGVFILRVRHGREDWLISAS